MSNAKPQSFSVRKNPPRRSRGDIIRSTNVGFADQYKTPTAGIGQSLEDRKSSAQRYSENFDLAFGKAV